MNQSYTHAISTTLPSNHGGTPTEGKNMKARIYEPNRKLLETLIGYVDAARVKTLDQYDRTEE